MELTFEQLGMRFVHALHRTWVWPVEDTAMSAVEFAQLYREAETVFLPALRGHGVCIQAGGHVGVWPYLMAGVFGRVHTFEPDARSYACLERNHGRRVTATHAALGRFDGKVGTEMVEANNRGAVRVVPGEDVPCVRIDGLGLNPDLIYLDVEGGERDALLGASETIARCRPVIGIEVKFGSEALDLLKGWGYREIGRSHNDRILKC